MRKTTLCGYALDDLLAIADVLKKNSSLLEKVRAESERVIEIPFMASTDGGLDLQDEKRESVLTSEIEKPF